MLDANEVSSLGVTGLIIITYQILYVISVLVSAIIGFKGLMLTQNQSSPKLKAKHVFFWAFTLGMGWAAITVFCGSRVFPNSTFLVSFGANYYCLFFSDILNDIFDDVLKEAKR